MKVFNYKVDDSTQKMDKVVFMEHIKTVFQPKFNQFLENITDEIYQESQGGADDNLKVVNEFDHGINEVNEDNDDEEIEVSRSPEENQEVKRLNQRILIIN